MYNLEGKTCLVTGGAGMVGSQLVWQLLRVGAKVIVVDDFSRGKTEIAGASYIRGDAGDLETYFHRPPLSIHVVFNLAAAVAGVEFNQRHHTYMFERNLRLQTVPAQAAARLGADRFLQTSSVCVYAPEHNSPAIEANGLLGEPTPANAGYSWAKRMGERYARWIGKETGLHTVIVRPSNIYGERDYFDNRAHVIPALIRKCVLDNEILVNGTGKEEREFIHAADVAQGMIAAITKGEAGEVYNLGTSGRTRASIRELLTTIQHLTNSIGNTEKDFGSVQFSTEFDPGDDRRWSDSSKAKEQLEWEATVELNDGLASVISWYLSEEMNE